MKVILSGFKGEAPRIKPQGLPDGMAQEAKDARVLSGDLEAWRGQEVIQTLPKGSGDDVVGIYPLGIDGNENANSETGPFWLHWTDGEATASGGVDIARSLIIATDPEDNDERIYLTGLAGGPWLTDLDLATDPNAGTGYDEYLGAAGEYPYRINGLGLGGPDTAPETSIGEFEPEESETPITNQYAETADGSSGTVSGWIVDVGGLDFRETGEVVGFEAGEGNFSFYGESSQTSKAYQDLSSADFGALSTGGTFTLSWLQATGTEGSQATMYVEFYGQGGSLIETIDDEPLYAPDTEHEFEERQLTGNYPENFSTARIYMHFERVGSGDNDAYIDAIQLEASQPSFVADYSSFDANRWVVVDDIGNGGEASVYDRESYYDRPSDDYESTPGEPNSYALAPEPGGNGAVVIYKDFNAKNADRIDIQFVAQWGDSYHKVNRVAAQVFLGVTQSGEGLVMQILYESVRLITVSSFNNSDTGGEEARWDFDGISTAQGSGRVGTHADPFLFNISMSRSSAGYFDIDVTWKNVRGFNLEGTVSESRSIRGMAILGDIIGFGMRSKSGYGTNPLPYYTDIGVTVVAPSGGNSSSGGSGSGPSGNTVKVIYAYTFGKPDGSESQQSPVSSPAEDIPPGREVTVLMPGTAPDQDVDRIFLYRAATSSADTGLYLVPNPSSPNGDNSIALSGDELSGTEFIDTTTDQQLSIPLETQDFSAPPAGLSGLVVAANGITYGFVGNQVCPSPINQPYTYPVEYRLATDFPIVAAAVMDTDLVVATQSHPYIVVGSDPAALDMAKLEKPQGCVAKRSMQTLEGFGVVYASPDGLTAVSRGSVEVITKRLFDRKAWQALRPETIHSVVHDGRYYFWVDPTGNANDRFGFVLDPDPAGFGLIRLDVWCSAAYSNPLDDKLYMAVPNGGATNLVVWDSENEPLIPYSWLSKKFQVPHPAGFAACQVRADDYASVTLKFYVDDSSAPVWSKAVTSGDEFHMPDEVFANRTIEVRIEGTSRVRRVEFAEAMEEIA